MISNEVVVDYEGATDIEHFKTVVFDNLIIPHPKYPLKVTQFARTERFSTYLFAVCAGPYKYIERNTPGYPPMRVYTRVKVAEEFDLNYMFDYAQEGIKFYTEYFGTAFPFSKYD